MKRTPRLRLSPIIAGKDLARDLDQVMMCLGEIANAWAGIEESLCLVFCHLSQTEYDTATVIFYTPSSFRGRLEIVRNLARHRMPKCTEQALLLAALDKLNGLNTKRNALVHARYGMLSGQRGDGTPYGWVTRNNVHPGKGALQTSLAAQLGEMDEHLDNIGAISQFLYYFCSWQNDPPCPIRAWARKASIKPGTTSA